MKCFSESMFRIRIFKAKKQAEVPNKKQAEVPNRSETGWVAMK
jgi:hypothetical protein